MASKFQNRLVGTIVLVALGVIILPGLLDGQKKHYQDEFAAIPLVPKPVIAMNRICCRRQPGVAFATAGRGGGRGAGGRCRRAIVRSIAYSGEQQQLR